MKLAETVYKMGRVGSSELIEFLIAALVGLLAALGALFCIGFLLVDPVRNPMGEGEVLELSKFAHGFRACECAKFIGTRVQCMGKFLCCVQQD